MQTPPKLSVSGLFLLAGLLFILSGFFSSIFGKGAPIDIHLHDTYFVIAHFHVMVLVAIIFFFFSAVYLLYPRILRRQMNTTAGFVHFLITLILAVAIFWPTHYEGVAGMPRRYYDYNARESFRQFAALNGPISIMVVMGFIGQIVFVLNFFLSLFTGRKSRT